MPENSLLFRYILFFAIAIVFSILINGLFLKFSRTLGIRDNADTLIRWGTAKPSLGGISFYIIFLLSICSYSVLFRQPSPLFDEQLVGFLGAATMAFLLGLADDAYNTRPFIKLGVQILCAFVLISTNTYIQVFDTAWLNYLFTFLWVIGIMNAINMIDNMDSIATIVSIVILCMAVFIQYSQQNFSNIYVLLLIGITASLLGFLFFNWHPSKMYMGDTGSQFLGVVMASVGIVCFWNAPDTFGQKVQSKQILAAALAFIIPLVDTTSVILNRMLKGRSPFIGGRDHTTHSLFFMGITEKRIAVLFAFIGMVSMLLIYSIHSTQNWGYFHISLYSGYLVAVFSVLFYIVRKKAIT